MSFANTLQNSEGNRNLFPFLLPPFMLCLSNTVTQLRLSSIVGRNLNNIAAAAKKRIKIAKVASICEKTREKLDSDRRDFLVNTQFRGGQ